MKPSPIPTEALAALHDVVAPEQVSLFPATPAWLVVFALLVVALARVALWLFRRWRQNLYRREAAAELRRIEARLTSHETREAALADLPVLVKRVALHFASRDKVAPLSDSPWLEFLVRTWKGAAFRAGPGRLLPEIAYATPARLAGISPADVDALVSLLREWIPAHRAPSGAKQKPPPVERAP